MRRDVIFSVTLAVCALAALLIFGTIGVAPAVLVALAVGGLTYFKTRRTRTAIDRQRAKHGLVP